MSAHARALDYAVAKDKHGVQVGSFQSVQNRRPTRTDSESERPPSSRTSQRRRENGGDTSLSSLSVVDIERTRETARTRGKAGRASRIRTLDRLYAYKFGTECLKSVKRERYPSPLRRFLDSLFAAQRNSWDDDSMLAISLWYQWAKDGNRAGHLLRK